jgi:hypothetical protein
MKQFLKYVKATIISAWLLALLFTIIIALAGAIFNLIWML